VHKSAPLTSLIPPATIRVTVVRPSTPTLAVLALVGANVIWGASAVVSKAVLAHVPPLTLYGTIRLHQERSFPGRVSGTELWSPDFVRYAEAFGGLGIRVECNDDIADAVHTALMHPGIAVLSIAVSQETIAVGTSLSAVAAG
jgi:acetolactate synthase I/II/III large subunit